MIRFFHSFLTVQDHFDITQIEFFLACSKKHFLHFGKFQLAGQFFQIDRRFSFPLEKFFNNGPATGNRFLIFDAIEPGTYLGMRSGIDGITGDSASHGKGRIFPVAPFAVMISTV